MANVNDKPMFYKEFQGVEMKMDDRGFLTVQNVAFECYLSPEEVRALFDFLIWTEPTWYRG